VPIVAPTGTLPRGVHTTRSERVIAIIAIAIIVAVAGARTAGRFFFLAAPKDHASSRAKTGKKKKEKRKRKKKKKSTLTYSRVFFRQSLPNDDTERVGTHRLPWYGHSNTLIRVSDLATAPGESRVPNNQSLKLRVDFRDQQPWEKNLKIFNLGATFIKNTFSTKSHRKPQTAMIFGKTSEENHLRII
jgi:hypothetical protein